MAELDELTAAPPEPVAPDEAAATGPGVLEWERNKQGREYIAARGRKGVIYRQGSESVADALERDARPKTDRPKRKSKAPPKPPPPTKADLREMEKLLSEALLMPGTFCAMVGDEWAADHFHVQAPNLARNLILAAEHNPWLRRQLEAAASAGTLPMQLMAMLTVSGALLMYIAPPVIWWFNLPVPDQARQIMNIPPRREHAPEPPHTQPETAERPEFAAAA